MDMARDFLILLGMNAALKSFSFAVCLALAAPLVASALASDSDVRPNAPVQNILPRADGDQTPRGQALARLNAVVEGEQPMPLQQGSQTRVYLQSGPARGTIVMYHGFSAGTWQFEILARRAYADGFNVYIPRLPGHGLHDAKGVEDARGLLTGRNWRDYETFADSTITDVSGLGAPISVIGLSVGGAIALSAAEQHPEIVRVAVYAPFLQAAGAAKIPIDAERVVDDLTFGIAGSLLGLLPVHWSRDEQAKTASGERPGFTRFTMANLYAVTQFGRGIVKDTPQLKQPVQFFTTAIDHAADEPTIRKVYNAIGGAPHSAWYQYPAAEKVPHAMIHPYEDNGAGHTPALYDMTMNFLETGEEFTRP